MLFFITAYQHQLSTLSGVFFLSQITHISVSAKNLSQTLQLVHASSIFEYFINIYKCMPQIFNRLSHALWSAKVENQKSISE